MKIAEEIMREVEKRTHADGGVSDAELLAADGAFWTDVPHLSTYGKSELEVALCWFRRGFISCMRGR